MEVVLDIFVSIPASGIMVLLPRSPGRKKMEAVVSIPASGIMVLLR